MKRRDFLAGLLGSTAGVTLSGCGFERWLSEHPHVDDGALRALRVDHDLCVGCRFCEEACVDANRRAGLGDEPLISVHSFPGPYHVAWACLGCPDIPCVSACDYYADPLGHLKALHVDADTGAVSLDREWCAACERCIEACERDGGGVLHWDAERYIAGACNLCGGSPACIPACPEAAISLVVVDRAATLLLRTPEATARDGLERLRQRQESEEIDDGEVRLRALRVDHERCTGCRRCESACDEANRPRTIDGVALAGPGDVCKSLITVRTFPGPFYVAWACLGCPDVPCVEACKAEDFGRENRRALYVDERTGAVAFDAAFCTECQECVDACRREGGAVLRWDPAALVTGACHLCGGDPACVRECPESAIEIVDVDRSCALEARRPEEVARRGSTRLFGGRVAG